MAWKKTISPSPAQKRINHALPDSYRQRLIFSFQTVSCRVVSHKDPYLIVNNQHPVAIKLCIEEASKFAVH